MALTTNLEAYYKLDESSGNAADSSGNSHTLTNSNSVAYAAAKINNGADFGTANTNKRLYQNASAMNIDGGAMTFSAWVKARASITTGNWWVCSQSNPGTDVQFNMYYAYNGGTRKLVFVRDKWAVSGNSVDVTHTLSTSAFEHLVMRYDGTTLEAFIDGVSQGTVAASGSGTGLPYTGFSIGASVDSDTSLNASIIADEVGVWSRALTNDEIASLYNGGAGNQYPFAISVTVSSTVVSSTISTQAPTVTGGALVASSVLTATFSTQSPSELIDEAYTPPQPISAIFSIPAVNIITPDSMFTASIVSAVFSVPSIVVSTSTDISAPVSSATFSVQPATFSGSVILTPDALGTSITVQIPAVDVISNVVISASVATSTFSIQSPTVTAEQNAIFAAPLSSAIFSTQTVTVIAIMNVTVTATVPMATFSTYTPTRVGGLWTPQPRAQGTWTPQPRVI